MKKTSLLQRVCSLVIIVSLFIQQSGFAQVAEQVNIAGYLSGIKNNFTQDKFRPVHLRYLQYLPAENGFKLLLDKGDFVGAGLVSAHNRNNKEENITQETEKLMEYFSVGLRLANESFWVNLRPDSQDNIIDGYLAQTDIGRVMLETDLQLKKDLAKMTSPETAQGKIYWDKLYKKAEELFGYENVTIPTLTRPWIVPGEVIISETADSAYIYKATLKVMLEEDYLRREQKNTVGTGLAPVRYEFNDLRAQELNTYSTQLIKELIIPKLTQEVNSSKRYAQLRQVYYSLIMAQWFKSRVSLRGALATKQSFINQIDSKNLTGLTSKIPWSKDTYYKQYQKSFKDGEYNMQETVRTPTGQVIRSYFSGGEMLNLPKIVKGEIPVNNAASPVIFSLPAAASSAISYDPEQMAAIEVNGELDVVNMEEPDSGLSRQRTVSSSMSRFNAFLLTIIIGVSVGTMPMVAYKYGVMEPNRIAQERVHVLAESAYYGSDTAIDELGIKMAQDDGIEAQAAGYALENLAFNGKDKAFKILADSAKNRNKIALNAIISLAHRNYVPAQEWLRNIDPSFISSANPNPLASEVVTLLTPDSAEAKGLQQSAGKKSAQKQKVVEIKETLLDPNTIELFAELRALKVSYGQRGFRTEEEHIFNILRSFYLLYDMNIDFENKKRYGEKPIEKKIISELYLLADKIGLQIITLQDITAGKYSVSEGTEVQGDLIVLVDKEGVLLTLPIDKVWGFRAEEEAFSKIAYLSRSVVWEEKNQTNNVAREEREQARNAAREKRDNARNAAREKKNKAKAAALEERDNIIAGANKEEAKIANALEAYQTSNISWEEYQQIKLDVDSKIQEAKVAAENTYDQKIAAAEEVWDKEYTAAEEVWDKEYGLTERVWNEKHDKAQRIAEEKIDKAEEKDYKAQIAFVNNLRWSEKSPFVEVKSLKPKKTSMGEETQNNKGSEKKESPKDNCFISAVGSSPVGGIDFTAAFPIITRAVSNLSAGAGGISMDRLLRVDLRRDWSEIERMASSGIRVSPERLKEYAQASCAQDVMDRDKVLLCISDRLKQEEECGLPAEPLVIDMLAVFLSAGSQAQLKTVFVGK